MKTLAVIIAYSAILIGLGFVPSLFSVRNILFGMAAILPGFFFVLVPVVFCVKLSRYPKVVRTSGGWCSMIQGLYKPGFPDWFVRTVLCGTCKTKKFPHPKAGDPLPSVSVLDLSGKERQLSEFLQPGRPLILNFGSWS